jgi:hypothetical protein
VKIQTIEISNYKAFHGTHEIRTELEATIQAVKDLRAELDSL